jgi:hypothetical protein
MVMKQCSDEKVVLLLFLIINGVTSSSNSLHHKTVVIPIYQTKYGVKCDTIKITSMNQGDVVLHETAI